MNYKRRDNAMKKSILTLAICGLFVMATSVVYGETLELTKDAYIEEVIVNNFELTQLEEDLVDETKEYKAALRTAKSIDELTWDEFNDNYETKESKTRAVKAKMYNSLKEGKEYYDKYIEVIQKRDAITLAAENNYYNYLNAIKDLEIKNENLKLTKDKYDVKVTEERIGQASALDLLAYEKTYNDALGQQLKASNLVDKRRNTFNLYIDRPINTAIELSQVDIVLPDFKINSLDVALPSLLENSYLKKTQELELKRLEMDRTVKGRTSGFGDVKIELEQNEIAVKEVKEQIEDATLIIEYQLRTNYNNTLAAENVFKSAELQLEIAKTNLNVAKVKEKNDMISSLDYIQAKQNYDSAVKTYLDAKLAAYTAYVSFNNFMNLNSLAVPMDLK